MARNYCIAANATNTASGTLPLMTVISTTSIRPKIYAIESGADGSPADNAAKYQIQRCTSTGTVGSAVTPTALDPGDPVALTTSGLAVFSVGPTLTGNAFLHQWAQNMRPSYRWFAYDMSKALVLPALAGNGVALICPGVTPSAFNGVFAFSFEE